MKRWHYDYPIPLSGVSADSRTIAKGDIFVALAGTKANGWQFIGEAITKGAAAIIMDERVLKTPSPELAIILDNLAARSIPVIAKVNPSQELAYLAHHFHPGQPRHCFAVTGTNGKSSVADFVRQLASLQGNSAASLGTLGLRFHDENLIIPQTMARMAQLTTPDAVSLAKLVAYNHAQGIDYLAMEASSHGLSQYRLDGIHFQAAAFTNLTRDHLDYHQTMEAYGAAKLRLFSEIMPAKAAIICEQPSDHGDAVSHDIYQKLIAIALKRNLRICDFRLQYGDRKFTRYQSLPPVWLQVIIKETTPFGFKLEFHSQQETFHTSLNLIGTFQLRNAITALGLVTSPPLLFAGKSTYPIGLSQAIGTLPLLQAVPGRLELAANLSPKARIFVDYAHTPDALRAAITSLRDNLGAKGKLHLVFGCGGNRDQGKRPLMGAIAHELVNGTVIITDDNPRFEEAASIRAQIHQAAPNALVIGDRRQAIEAGLDCMKQEGLADNSLSHQALLIAGKGHEAEQIIKDQKLAFDDRVVARELISQSQASPLWYVKDIEAALHQQFAVKPSLPISGISTDSRTIGQGDLFIGLSGTHFEGGDHAPLALEKGASAAIINQNSFHKLGPDFSAASLLCVEDGLAALTQLARYRRQQHRGLRIAITGSVGKTSLKEAVSQCLSPLASTHASQGNLNNHIGLPLSLARLKADSSFAIFELGMNHKGEIDQLSELLAPDIAMITTIAPAHLENFDNLQAIALAKAEIFNHTKSGGLAIIPRDSAFYPLLQQAAKVRGLRIFSFGLHPESDLRWITHDLAKNSVKLGLKSHEFWLPMPRKSKVQQQVIGATIALLANLSQTHGIALAQAMAPLRGWQPPKGRGQWEEGQLADGTRVTIIDESYNASPLAMKLAIQNLQDAPNPSRRVAVLGDMLELGENSKDFHKAIGDYLAHSEVDLVLTVGHHATAIASQIPKNRLVGHYEDCASLLADWPSMLKEGDYILIKASRGIGLDRLIPPLQTNRKSKV